MTTTVHRAASGWRVFGTGALAGALAVAVNLAIRALVLAFLVRPDVPYPLVLPPVVEFTLLSTLLGTAVFLVLRRFTGDPLRWFAFAALGVVALSWIAPLVLFVQGEITVGVFAALVAMHVTPAVVLMAALQRTVRS